MFNIDKIKDYFKLRSETKRRERIKDFLFIHYEKESLITLADVPIESSSVFAQIAKEILKDVYHIELKS